jgi:dTDP-glucose 4,6-dehydratase
VSDLIEGIYRLMMSDFTDPVNIGNPAEMSVLEFAKVIIEITGSKSKIVYENLPVDDPKVRRPDISKAKELLGWEPKVELREGLSKTIEYFNEFGLLQQQ